MNLETEFSTKIKKLSTQNPAYVRNVMKEVLQDFTLNYIYNSDYNKLIFTGGTCLRKVYGLDRLSEDLDFDFTDIFNIKEFASDLKSYFKNLLSLETDMKISGNNQTMFIKIPLKKYKNLTQVPIDSDVLFLRCDFSKETYGGYKTEANIISAANFSFFVKNYDLPTLFSNKIIAFLERNFYKGKTQEVSFKGRDVYDLFWLLNLSSKTSFNIKPNYERLYKLSGQNKINLISNQLKDKLNIIDKKYLYDDLYPLVESEVFLRQFIDNYDTYINEKISYVMNS